MVASLQMESLASLLIQIISHGCEGSRVVLPSNLRINLDRAGMDELKLGEDGLIELFGILLLVGINTL